MLTAVAELARGALLQAALALGIAGLGRIAFNSLLGLHYGADLFASYAKLASEGLLLGSLAAAGPAAAVTISVARDWHATRSVTRDGALSLAAITLVMAICVIGAGTQLLPISTSERPLVAMLSVTIAIYQVTRALGYAIDGAFLVTKLELLGALTPLLVLVLSSVWKATLTPESAITIFLTGPAIFCFAAAFSIWQRVPLGHDTVSATATPRLARIALIFFVGAGSAAALQYVPTVLSAQTIQIGITSVLFGAVQATAPLLLFSRVYATIQMPRIAADASQ